MLTIRLLPNGTKETKSDYLNVIDIQIDSMQQAISDAVTGRKFEDVVILREALEELMTERDNH